MCTMHLAMCVKPPDSSQKIFDIFSFRATGAIISHPLVQDAAVMVCPPLLPVRTGTASTLELTDYKCLPLFLIHILSGCVLNVIQTWSSSYFKRMLEGTHLSQGLLRNNNIGIVAILCIAIISLKQLDLLASSFSFSGQTGWGIRR